MKKLMADSFLGTALTLMLVFTPALIEAQEEQPTDEQAKIQAKASDLLSQVTNSGPRFALNGTVTAGKNTKYAINGEDFVLDPDARVYGELRIGADASVSGKIEGGKKIARIANVVTTHSQKEKGTGKPVQDGM
jgi:hypothetical protein